MGQKVNPVSLRLGITNTWASKWFAQGKRYTTLFHKDLALKALITKKLKNAGVTRIEIERSSNKVVVNIHSAKPGLIIGRQGVAIDDLKDLLSKTFNEQIDVNIIEVTQPDLSALLIGEMVGAGIEKRVAYRRIVKKSIQQAIQAGAKGIKVQVSGRLNGVEISRTEFFKEGNIPLHTLRADIDYAKVRANTTYGVIGIKVWIFKSLIFNKKTLQNQNPDQ